jgi:putative molybdopterin biosynthesis protein
LRIAGLADLARPGLRIVQRGPGTGTRLVLQELLRAAGMPALASDAPVEVSHRAVAAAVASGSIDVGFGIEAAARAAGLDFIALARERYFLVTLAPHLDDPRVQALRAALQTAQWLEMLETIPGHTPDESGQVLSLRRVLPWWSYRRAKP